MSCEVVKMRDHVRIFLTENTSTRHTYCGNNTLYFLLYTLGRLQHFMLLKTELPWASERGIMFFRHGSVVLEKGKREL